MSEYDNFREAQHQKVGELIRFMLANPQAVRADVTRAELQEAIDWWEGNPDLSRAQIFSFKGHDTNIMLHFNLDTISAAIKADPAIAELVTFQIFDKDYRHIRYANGVEDAHLERIKNSPFLFEPVMFAVTGDSQILIDGNHRVVRMYLDGYRHMRGYLVPEGVWSNHLVKFPPVLDRLSEVILDHGIEKAKVHKAEANPGTGRKTCIHR